MALSTEDLNQIEQLLKRKPSTVETSIFDTMWSEHCSYKSSKPVLKQLPTDASSIALGIGEDAGIIRFHKHNNKQYCVAISHESHNHPSQILPIEGAATGVGGCVRDVYCMGANVIGVLNSLHFGIKGLEGNTLIEEIEKKVVLGIADYGNPLGVPVLGGETVYHSSYNDNCLVNVAALGLLTEDEIIHSYVPKQAANEPYDLILFGKPTDATGFGGASFSSATLDENNQESNLGAVQVHDPFLKRVLVEAIKTCLEFVKENKLAIGFKDLGAGGISCATSEIAVAGGFGVTIDLNKVNVAYPNLKPEVIACSETQERFCLAVPKSHSQKICDIFNCTYEMPNLHPNSGAYVIGEVVPEMRYTILHNNETLCDLPVECITTEVHANRLSQKRSIKKSLTVTPKLKSSISIQDVCYQYLTNKMNVSKRYVYRFFDNAVGGNTVVYPGEADAVVVKPIQDSNVGLAVSMDSNLYGHSDPYVSGAYAVAESVRNVISVGATPIALTDCLNYGNPEKPEVFFDFEQGVQGIRDAANILSFSEEEPIPIISGNVSFYNESKQGNAVVPSPVICVMGKVDDIRDIKTTQLFDEDLSLLLIGKRYAEFKGTQLEPYIDDHGDVSPQVRFDEERVMNRAILDLYQSGLIESCHDISSGGSWIALIEMVLGERGKPFVGIDISLNDVDAPIDYLFSENGGYVVATRDRKRAQEQLDKAAIHYAHIGQTNRNKVVTLTINNTPIRFDIDKIYSSWNRYNP